MSHWHVQMFFNFQPSYGWMIAKDDHIFHWHWNHQSDRASFRRAKRCIRVVLAQYPLRDHMCCDSVWVEIKEQHEQLPQDRQDTLLGPRWLLLTLSVSYAAQLFGDVILFSSSMFHPEKREDAGATINHPHFWVEPPAILWVAQPFRSFSVQGVLFGKWFWAGHRTVSWARSRLGLGGAWPGWWCRMIHLVISVYFCIFAMRM